MAVPLPGPSAFGLPSLANPPSLESHSAVGSTTARPPRTNSTTNSSNNNPATVAAGRPLGGSSSGGAGVGGGWSQTNTSGSQIAAAVAAAGGGGSSGSGNRGTNSGPRGGSQSTTSQWNSSVGLPAVVPTANTSTTATNANATPAVTLLAARTAATAFSNHASPREGPLGLSVGAAAGGSVNSEAQPLDGLPIAVYYPATSGTLQQQTTMSESGGSAYSPHNGTNPRPLVGFPPAHAGSPNSFIAFSASADGPPPHMQSTATGAYSSPTRPPPSLNQHHHQQQQQQTPHRHSTTAVPPAQGQQSAPPSPQQQFPLPTAVATAMGAAAEGSRRSASTPNFDGTVGGGDGRTTTTLSLSGHVPTYHGATAVFGGGSNNGGAGGSGDFGLAAASHRSASSPNRMTGPNSVSNTPPRPLPPLSVEGVEAFRDTLDYLSTDIAPRQNSPNAASRAAAEDELQCLKIRFFIPIASVCDMTRLARPPLSATALSLHEQRTNAAGGGQLHPRGHGPFGDGSAADPFGATYASVTSADVLLPARNLNSVQNEGGGGATSYGSRSRPGSSLASPRGAAAAQAAAAAIAANRSALSRPTSPMNSPNAAALGRPPIGPPSAHLGSPNAASGFGGRGNSRAPSPQQPASPPPISQGLAIPRDRDEAIEAANPQYDWGPFVLRPGGRSVAVDRLALLVDYTALAGRSLAAFDAHLRRQE